MLSVHLSKEESELLDFSELDLCYRSIKVINNVPDTVKFISRLYLNGNYLMSLSGIEQFYNLEVFHFNYNLVSLPAELEKIHNPFFIREISFIANPIYHCRELDLEGLRKRGFSRLVKINQFQSQSSPAPRTVQRAREEVKNKRVNETMASAECTARRMPSYKHSPELIKTNRKTVGKIYYNSKFMTAQQHENQKPPQNSKETRDSTLKHSFEESAIALKSNEPSIEKHHEYREVKPFDHSLIAESDQTAKFSGETQIVRFGEQFLAQQKQRLADVYYKRSTLQKYFGLLKAVKRMETVEQQISPFEGEILNNKLETIHFSLIKLKHELIQRT